MGQMRMSYLNFKKIGYIIRLILVGFKKYRKRLLLVTGLGFLSGLFGSIGIGAIIPLFSLATGTTTGGLGFISTNIGRVFKFFYIPFTPLYLLAFIAGLFILKGLIQFAAQYTNEKVAAQFGEETRNDLLNRTFKASWPYLINQQVGRLETMLLQDVQVCSSLFIIISSFILLLTSFIAYAFVALAISVHFTLVTIALGATLIFVLKPISYKVRKLAQETADVQKMLSHHVSEYIIGMKVVKATALESTVIKKGKEYFKKIREAKTKASFYKQASVSFIEPGVSVAMALLFVFSYKSLGFNIATFAVSMYLIQKMFGFVQAMQTHIQEIYESIPYLKAIMEYRHDTSKNIEIDYPGEDFNFNTSITFDSVSFFYNPEKDILSDFNLSIKKSEIIGLIGHSGAGKTTLVDLILRLFKPKRGAILIDGKDLNNLNLHRWREKIGYVSQDTFLINDSVASNVRFHKDATSEEGIVEALKMANIYATVLELPQGIDTIVGERGIKLSGGQKQRIALARALAKKPEVLILDEATSAIDGESEKLIQESIKSLRGKMTILIIAHRPSTVMNCDRLVVLEGGKILEEGSPEALLNNPDSYFYRMR